MADIIINDESYSQMSTLFLEVGQLMEERLSAYIGILDDIIGNGVKGGYVHDNLVIFKSKVVMLEGLVEECLTEVQSLCTQFVESIDEADSELY